MYAEKMIYTQSGIDNGYSYAPYVNMLFTWESIVFDRHIRPARGNTRTKLGNMYSLLGLILAQILSLALS